MRLPLLFSSVACHFAREGDGRHRRRGAVARAEARS
jgi:hypothetical protein